MKGTWKLDVQKKKIMTRVLFGLEGRGADGGIKIKEEEEKEYKR